MSGLSQSWLEEMNLAPMWRVRANVADGIPAPAPEAHAPEVVVREATQTAARSDDFYFVTLRLADSLPPHAPQELEQMPRAAAAKRVEEWLDEGHGSCWLGRPAVAQLVAHALRAFDGKRYRLRAWVVMPNHAHLVLAPLGEHALSDILHSLKSYTAAEANRLLDRDGAFWSDAVYERLLRNPEEVARSLTYVEQNPVRAGLAADAAQYAFGRAGFDARTADVEAPAEPEAKPGTAEVPNEAMADVTRMDWERLRATVTQCVGCALHAKRTQAVFGVGDPAAELLFVGEGPGEEEDKQGEPFVGQAGKLLDNMLASIRLKRGERVYIANVVKCRPPGNRNPEPAEAAACAPYLDRQIDLIQPKLIVALGKVAAVRLLGREASIASLRGQTLDYRGIPLIVTYHPAYLLRNLPDKARAWEDLCRIRRTLGDLQKAAAAPN